MVGDTENDRKGAEDAAVPFLGVSYGFGFRNDGQYDFVVVPSVPAILSYIEGADK